MSSLHRLAEERPGGRLDPEGAVAEVDLVEVHLEDAVLRVAPLQLQREHRLLELALEALVGGEEEHLGELLGDGAAPFHDAAAPEVLVDGARDAHRIHAVVGVEARVLGGDDRLAERLRDLGEGHEDAPLDVELGDELVVVVVDLGALARRRTARAAETEGREPRQDGEHPERGGAATPRTPRRGRSTSAAMTRPAEPAPAARRSVARFPERRLVRAMDCYYTGVIQPSRHGPTAVDEQLARIRRGAAEIIVDAELRAKLERSRRTGTPLQVKLGLDPTAPDLHLGHTVVLQKLRDFQDLGHQVIFVIGDFTGMIGDPTGSSETRQPLTRDEIAATRRRTEAQLGKILDMSRTRCGFNSAWLGPLTLRARHPRDRAADGRAHPAARGLRHALRGGAPDQPPRVPLSARAGLRFGRARRGRRDGRHRSDVQPARGP